MEEKELTYGQLPKQFRDKLNDTLERTDRFKRLRKRLDDCMSRRDYVGIVQTREDIRKAQERVYDEYLKQHKTIMKRADALVNNMTKDDKERWQLNVHTMLILVDMMETTCMEINEVVGKYMENGRIDRFDKVVEAGREAREQTSWMFHVSDSVYQNNFADAVDNLMELIHNKVRSLLRKTHLL